MAPSQTRSSGRLFPSPTRAWQHPGFPDVGAAINRSRSLAGLVYNELGCGCLGCCQCPARMKCRTHRTTLSAPLGRAGHSSHLHPKFPGAAGCWDWCGSLSQMCSTSSARSKFFLLTKWELENNPQPSVCVRIAREICFPAFFFPLLTAPRERLDVQNTVKWKNFASLSSLNKACHEPGSSINPGKTALGASQ